MSTTTNDMQDQLSPPSLIKTLGWFDWAWALMLIGGAGYALSRYSPWMDSYEQGILVGVAVATVWLGWTWKPVRPLLLAVATMAFLAIFSYGGALVNAESNFFLRFLISSQSAVMWMSALFVLATPTYFIAMLGRSEFTGKVASAMTWLAVTMGLVGLMVRWWESYLLGADIGHIPVSNLYEVFILFSVITALLYLYYEQRLGTRALGGFALLVISAAVGFILWYTFDRHADEIQPLVPALQSYWMKIHVPANFIGYGAFSLAAMVGVAYLFKVRSETPNQSGRLPALDILDNLMYRSIALGFAFFTIATILGAMWAAEAWGGYWSWDPKETWALIVWLNYAAWLHMRLTKGWRGTPMAWWSVAGLFVTLFAFLGVNMFLSGLHSYGEL
ncbi:MAG TPA: c-type cytochrome biogenesis protein CcsB [Chromatiales bacterium]|jgi:cytochrome c-type biogenesis protein CcsB|nr:c-type cytochrome biogenesis protein CcsB [Chromatiaceae bacterium]HIN82133.1 c-type cytochrome biogenesis protein CcsB [Chromatiales bacterium]HIO14381.1 c-type cytochrome biogenesis protein CcsB [Chromatiales bacterium]HIO53857.1 c-type cytochrome biogenesis protein CcsB [Chromatiales bacterium]